MQFETALQFPTIMDNLLDKNTISVSVESVVPAKCDDEQARWGARGAECDPPGGLFHQQPHRTEGMAHHHEVNPAEDLHGCEWISQAPLLDEYAQHSRGNSAYSAKPTPALFSNDAPHDADYAGQYLGPCWLTDLNQPEAATLFPVMLDEANPGSLVDPSPYSAEKQHGASAPVPVENLLTLFYPPAPEEHHEDAEFTSLEMFCNYYEQHEGYDSARNAKNQRLGHRYERHHSLCQYNEDVETGGSSHENLDLGARHSLCDPHMPLENHSSSADYPKQNGNDVDDRKPFLRSSRSKPSSATIEPRNLFSDHQQHSFAAPTPIPMPMTRLNTRTEPTAKRVHHIAPSSLSLFADIRMMTALNDCYWKNGRKNLQCFPACPEHNDFYSMKMSNNKHSSVGVCRGPIYCHVFTRQSDASSTPSLLYHAPEHASLSQDTQSMKFASSAGSASTGGSDHELFVLGRFERVPHRPNDDENKNLADELDDPPEFSSTNEFEKFRFSCFQAVEMEERRVVMPHPGARNNSIESPTTRSTWFFLPDVWKVHPMLKKKRKATRSAPAQTFPFCFRVFVYTRNPAVSSRSDARFSCIAASASSFFELYSTRTVDRVKRKFWTAETETSASTAGSARKRQRAR